MRLSHLLTQPDRREPDGGESGRQKKHHHPSPTSMTVTTVPTYNNPFKLLCCSKLDGLNPSNKHKSDNMRINQSLVPKSISQHAFFPPLCAPPTISNNIYLLQYLPDALQNERFSHRWPAMTRRRAQADTTEAEFQIIMCLLRNWLTVK